MSKKQSAAEIVSQLIGELNEAFDGSPNKMPAGVQLTTDLQEALAFVHKSKTHKNAKRLYSLGEKWVEYLYSETSRVSALYRFDNPELSLGLMRESDRLYEVLYSILSKSHSNRFGEIMYVYVPFILDARAGDPKNPLAANLVSILCARGIPCGCYGAWPESPIVVYWPWKKEEPVFEK